MKIGLMMKYLPQKLIPFVIECESDWKSMETVFIGLINEYLSYGKYVSKLKEYLAVGIRFVDGALHILL